MDSTKQYDRWIQEMQVKEDLKSELMKLTNPKEIEDRFYKNLEFGTGGLRGKLAAGSNRMNVHTVGKVTQGLANYLIKVEDQPSVAIAYDSRNRSEEFAQMAASTLAANGIKVYLYEELRPTPMLSFAVRHLKTDAGIVITASHNPREYNGYKVYGNDGGQLTDKLATEISCYIDQIDIFQDVKAIGLEEAVEKGLVEYIGKEVDEAYYKEVEKIVINREFVKAHARELNIIYTPIHGSGNIPVRTMLNRLGFEKLAIVKEQEQPDGNFPTAPYPNPEDKKVFGLAIEMAKEIAPDIILGTDPDCDRIGVVVRDTGENYKVLTGNQIGCLLTDYMLSAKLRGKSLSEKDTIVKTIVSSDMPKAICKYYGAKWVEVLTGFKYIGEKIEEFAKTDSNNFVLGFEESYGYLSGDFVRDKDAVIASVLIAEMALYYKTRGQNLEEALQELYQKYGYYKEELISIQMEGQDGEKEIKQILDKLRRDKPKQIGGNLVEKIEDYKYSTAYHLLEGEEKVIELPVSNVMKFTLADGSWFVVRPSGTEAKMKIYLSTVGSSGEEVQGKLTGLKGQVLQLIKD